MLYKKDVEWDAMSKVKVISLSEASPEELRKLLARSAVEVEEIKDKVVNMLLDVKRRGDQAILEFYEKFYGKKVISELRISKEEFDAAWSKVSEEYIEAVKFAANNIRRFHEVQKPREAWFIEIDRGIWAGQIVRPLESVGVYVPGGRASYPSTALMTIIPAQVAGVKEIVVTTPPREDGSVDPHILVTLDVLGVRNAFKVGGVHAVAALAFGTQTIPKVEKIVGPGGLWFTAAKHVIRSYADVDIDFIAGPSEILVLADDTADPLFVAYDIISQLEHDPAAAGVLVTTSKSLAMKVKEILESVITTLPRSEIIAKALDSNGAIVLAKDLDEAIDFVNKYAPEHLEILVSSDNLFKVLAKIMNAGSIFLGPYSTVPLGDYLIGPNHVLPTSGWAKRRGGLGVLDFVKVIDVTYVVDREALIKYNKYLKILTEAEGLPNHYNALKTRLESM
ncbi:MAG: histidinol dehydrogenase [Desulfurococcaceae archaeon]